MAPNMLRHVSAVCCFMGSVLLPRNTLQVSECAGRYNALTQEVRSSGKAWRSHILETRQFLLDRGQKIYSLLMTFLPQRKTAFLVFYVLRVSHCLKAFSWRLFSVAIFLETETIGMVCHSWERETKIQTSVSSCFPCRSDPLSLGLCGKFLDSAGTQTGC